MRLKIYKQLKMQNLILLVGLVATLGHLVQPSYGRYIPEDDFGSSMDRRNDGEDEEMDQNASAPYQQGGKANQGDGYEENEPDGPYGETRREEEGQADMEKFFDDHLGASEKDGMDKENLPSNLKPQVSANDEARINALAKTMINKESPESMMDAISREGGDETTLDSVPAPIKMAPQVGSSWIDSDLATANNYSDPFVNDVFGSPEDFNQGYYKLGNQTSVENGASRRDDFSDSDFDPDPDDPLYQYHRKQIEKQQLSRRGSQKRPKTHRTDLTELEPSKRLEIHESTEDDGPSSQIFVTNMTDKPFRIDALGGYDPEEDFKAASDDIDAPVKFNTPLGNTPRSKANSNVPQSKDISFNDSEDTLFKDASEMDEVAFVRDDPYANDMESEMSGHRRPRRRKIEPTFESMDTDEQLDDYSSRARPRADEDYEDRADDLEMKPRNDDDDDDNEGNWVNDGVDDMEVPSQSYQDAVLEKAEKQEQLAKQNELASGNNNQPHEVVEDEDSQRMPNGDYLNDVKIEEN